MKNLNIIKSKFNFFTMIILSMALFFVSCEELQEEVEDPTQVEIAADAGSDVSAEVGTEVTLDGTNSTISEGTISYLWEFSSIPSGSTAQLNDATTSSPSFTPDVAGDYVVQLTVSSGDVSDTDEVTVTATETAPQTVEVSGTIDSDATWSDQVSDPSIPDYKVTGDLSLEATLTIEAGVLIHVAENVGIWVNKNGTLISNGESGSTVTITSTNEAGEIRWKGIFINSSSTQNSMAFTEIMYAGNSDFGSFSNFVDVPAAIGLYDDGKLNLTNSTVSNSGGYGMYIRYGILNSFSNNTFSDNDRADVGLNINQANMMDAGSAFGNGVEIFGSTSSQDVTLASLDGEMPYMITGNIYIKSVFEISAGAQLFFYEDKKLDVESDGTIKINGTEDNRVLMASEDTASELRWKGVFVRSTSAQNTIKYADITFAGSSNFGDFANFVDVPAGIGLTNSAKLELLNTNVRNSGGYGMYIRYGELTSFSSNSFSSNTNAAIGLNSTQAANIDGQTLFSNNGWDGVEIFGSSINDELTWTNLSGDASYHIIGNVSVASGGLTIDPGTKMEFDEDVKLDVNSDAYLIASGTSSNMITFTTSNEAGQIYWKGIKFGSQDARNELNYVHIKFGGGAEHDLSNFKDIKTAVSGNNNGNLTLTNSIIENSEGYGVYFQGSINDIESAGANNTFTNNPSGNFYN